jgi:hypothetical protein
VLYLPQDNSNQPRCLLLGFKKAMPRMCPASGQRDLHPSFEEAGIGRVAIGLKGSFKTIGCKLLQTGSTPTCLPLVKGFKPGAVCSPQIACPRLAMPKFQILDRTLIHLHITAPEYFFADGFINGAQPFCVR